MVRLAVVVTTLMTHQMTDVGCAYRSDRECVSARGCPEPAPLPRCDPGGEPPTPVGTYLAPDALPPLNRPVRLSGTLVRGDGQCTLLLCDPGHCCNGCGASIALQDPVTSKMLAFAYEDTGRWTCGGDDSGMCCGAPSDIAAVVEGRFVLRGESIEGPRYDFVVATACQP